MIEIEGLWVGDAQHPLMLKIVHSGRWSSGTVFCAHDCSYNSRSSSGQMGNWRTRAVVPP